MSAADVVFLAVLGSGGALIALAVWQRRCAPADWPDWAIVSAWCLMGAIAALFVLLFVFLLLEKGSGS
jgi:hypothetical protein